LGDFFSSSVSLCPCCVQLYTPLAGSPVVFLELLSIASAAALLRRLVCCASVDCGEGDGGRAVPHSCDCKAGPPSDVIHGPDVSWFGAFGGVSVPGDTSSSCLQRLRCLALAFSSSSPGERG
jgi:hypothetical protein